MFVAVLVAALPRTTDLTYVRHGETVANATGHYNSRTINEFSPKGRREVSALTRSLLAEPAFDEILVSPSPRALRTIAPYLAATHRRADVWPLLYECCTMSMRGAKPSRFTYGGPVVIPRDLRPYFVVSPTESKLPVAPDAGSGLAQVEEAVKVFWARLAGKRVLLVGHSGMGGQFLHALTGKWRKIENAGIYHVRLSR